MHVSRIITKALVAMSAATAMTLVGAVVFGMTSPAEALPSFARQTGQPCGACHTDFPQLTPFGRRFKLGGYTLGGGRDTAEYKRTFGGNQWMPPISTMGVITSSHTATSQGDIAPLPGNDYFNIQQGSLFYGGAITDELGAFIQGTMSDHQETAPNVSSVFLDNTDIRYVKNGSFFGKDALYGVTAHNNPTVQDVWNTAPAWGFPFVSSAFAPSPGAATLIEGNFASKVLGVGAYTFIDDMFYLEATAYKGFNRRWQNAFGVWDYTAVNSVMDRVSPYVRVAVEPHWGNHWLQMGAFWLNTSVNPSYVDMANPGTDPNVPGPAGYLLDGSDKYSDLGFDSQYQYMGDNYVLTLRGTYIHERQKLDSTFANGLSSNPTNTLNSLKAQASYAWNTDAPTNKWIVTGGYFNTWGSTDPTLYSANATGSPNSDGWIAEIAWFPFAKSFSPLWPYANARVGLQYTWYNKFNGASTNYDGKGRNASDNNTLFAYIWFAL